jgi:hypothetical protein
VAKDETIGAHELLDADPGWCLVLPRVGRNRFTIADKLAFALEPSP